jgi:pimeloyl-[acyl-carrier protein] methyl ester esterase
MRCTTTTAAAALCATIASGPTCYRSTGSTATTTLATGLSWLRDVDLRPLAPRVTAPTLLLHGAVDPLMPLAAAQALAQLIPGSRLHPFAGRAHAPFLSEPESFRATLAAFCLDTPT